MNIEDQFDPEVQQIENEIIQEVLKYNIFTIRGEITSKILLYFITRKNLSQSDLQKLTGFSAGKISQVLNNFLTFNLISISKKSKPWIYTMESVVAETFERSITLLKTNLTWESKFLKMKEDIVIRQDDLKKLNGFDKVRAFLDSNLMRFTGFKSIIMLWEDLKEKHGSD
ncbi:MAG: hypothetical protein ACXAAH_06080 [Promethearchaeota archaeon]|jgi:DNA-binding transcriptional regulator GbsR (MarR family)